MLSRSFALPERQSFPSPRPLRPANSRSLSVKDIQVGQEQSRTLPALIWQEWYLQAHLFRFLSRAANRDCSFEGSGLVEHTIDGIVACIKDGIWLYFILLVVLVSSWTGPGRIAIHNGRAVKSAGLRRTLREIEEYSEWLSIKALDRRNQSPEFLMKLLHPLCRPVITQYRHSENSSGVTSGRQGFDGEAHLLNIFCFLKRIPVELCYPGGLYSGWFPARSPAGGLL